MTWDPRKLDPEWSFDLWSTPFELDADSVALIVIDMQGSQMKLRPNTIEQYPQLAEYWEQRMDEVVVSNIQRLIAFFRERDLKIVYTRNGNVTATGDEVTDRLRKKFVDGRPQTHPGQPEYEVDERLAPRNVDLVVDKLTSGAFTAGMLDHALHNMGIKNLVHVGILTDACVFGTARAAAELGYNSLICEDACATLTQRAHDEALLMHARIFGRVGSTDDVLSELAPNERT